MSVLPIIFPPKIRLMPTSPTALAPAINSEANKVFLIFGSITNICYKNRYCLT